MGSRCKALLPDCWVEKGPRKKKPYTPKLFFPRRRRPAPIGLPGGGPVGAPAGRWGWGLGGLGFRGLGFKGLGFRV